MSDKPWFKFYAADFLTDAKIDALPPEAEGIVVRMWAICHIEGSCPADPEELSRKIRRPLAFVLKYKSYYESLFDLKGTSYVSTRMEKERKRSEINRTNVLKRSASSYKHTSYGIRSTNGNSNGSTSRIKTSDYDSDYGLDLELEVRKIAKLHPKIADPDNLSAEYATVIAEALARHGDKVLQGTEEFRKRYDLWPKEQLGFASGVSKFYRQSEYLFDPSVWDRNGLKPSSVREMDDFKRRHAIT